MSDHITADMLADAVAEKLGIDTVDVKVAVRMNLYGI